MGLDHKQRHLVNTWISYGTSADCDDYVRFISLWVAFNAICYGFYSSIANRKRADLQQDRGLSEVTNQPARLDGTVVAASNRVKLQIEKPGRIVITIAERYTEDIIFSRFAEEFQLRYDSWFANKEFETNVQTFRKAIRKRDYYYVINMARASEHNDEDDY